MTETGASGGQGVQAECGLGAGFRDFEATGRGCGFFAGGGHAVNIREKPCWASDVAKSSRAVSKSFALSGEFGRRGFHLAFGVFLKNRFQFFEDRPEFSILISASFGAQLTDAVFQSSHWHSATLRPVSEISLKIFPGMAGGWARQLKVKSIELPRKRRR
jgi:hypothetical protein